MGLIYEDRTWLLKSMFFEVQNEVGLGRQEEAYHQACKIWLEGRSISYGSKLPHRLMLGDIEAYVLFPDFVIWNELTVELKALPRRMNHGDVVQVFDYLKYRRDRLGLLVNFGLDRVEYHRYVYEPPTSRLTENWNHWSDSIRGSVREIGTAACAALRYLYQSHGTGYGEEVFQRLILGTLMRQGLNVKVRPVSKAYFHGTEVHESPLDCLILESCLLITYTALFDDIQFSINRGLSYMRSLGLEWGIAVDFGRSEACITGLRQLKSTN